MDGLGVLAEEHVDVDADQHQGEGCRGGPVPQGHHTRANVVPDPVGIGGPVANGDVAVVELPWFDESSGAAAVLGGRRAEVVSAAPDRGQD